MLLIGISACLLGESVRYDGGHKKNSRLLALADKRIAYLPLCPEAGCGLGVPREPMQLEGDHIAPRLVTIDSRQDKTALLTGWCRGQLQEMRAVAPCGFILKCRSPSCGVSQVKIHDSQHGTGFGVGLFAQQIKISFAKIPMVEDEDLNSEEAIELFLQEAAIYSAAQSGSGVENG